MIYLLTTLHIIFCLFLILVILLQTGKGGGMGVAFGGSGSSVFGPRGAGSFIGKLTAVVAFLFMLSSIVLAYNSSSKSTGLEKKASLMELDAAGKKVDIAKEFGSSKSKDSNAAKDDKKAPVKDAAANTAADAAPVSDTASTAEEAATEAEKPAAEDATPAEVDEQPEAAPAAVAPDAADDDEQ